MIESRCIQTGLWMLLTLQEISSVTMHCAICSQELESYPPRWQQTRSFLPSANGRKDDDLTILICDYISKRNERGGSFHPRFKLSKCKIGAPKDHHGTS
jgi:hypothetical protein